MEIPQVRARRTRAQLAPRAEGTVAAYIRVSTDEQTVSGAGLEAQRIAITEECGRRGWTVTSWHADEGISGAKDLTHRPALVAALEAIEAGAAVLMAAKSDRVARNVATLLEVIDRAEYAGGAIVAVDGTIDTSTTAGRFITQVMGAMAELERNMISDRTKAALAVKRSQGVTLGRPRTVPDDVVERIVRLRAAGATWQGIADYFNDEGVPTGQGGQWWAATVSRIAARAS